MIAAFGADRSDTRTTATRAAINLAGARKKDGFKLRDAHWTGTLQPGVPQVVEVNLFKGNSYWFTAAATPDAVAVSIHVFDESGRAVTAEEISGGTHAEAGFAPVVSGPYFVKLEETGNQNSTFCLVYTYK